MRAAHDALRPGGIINSAFEPTYRLDAAASDRSIGQSGLMPKTTKFADIIPVYVLAFLVVVAGYVTCSGAVQNQIAKLAVRRAYRGTH